jgi:NAD(P)-dependent dehydrogenase (short-subunit alcohol dehydrogenase family)
LVAFDLGARYLRSGELDLAIVGGISGNSGWEAADTLQGLGLSADAKPAEGAFLFALVRETTAKEACLPVLAFVDSAPIEQAANLPVIECGATNELGAQINYMGADSAWAVLRALHKGADVAVRCGSSSDQAARCLRVQRPGSPTPAPRMLDIARVDIAASVRPHADKSVSAPSKGAVDLVRMTPYWGDFPAELMKERTAWLTPGTVLVTDAPALIDELGPLPADLVVLSVRPFAEPRRGWFHVEKLEADALRALVGELGSYKHLRIFADLSVSAPAGSALSTPAPSLLALADLTFLTLKLMYDNLARAESSFACLFLGAWDSDALHPFAGLFSGMVKSAWLELGEPLTYCLFTSTRDVRNAVQEAEAESRARRLMPVVVYDNGQRKTLLVREADDISLDADQPLTSESIIFAVGGARGIAAEILKDIAKRYRPHIYIVGSNDVGSYSDAALQLSDEEFSRSRAEFLRWRKLERPQSSIAALNSEFDRMGNARATRRNLQELEHICGHGKVHYRACNVLDRESLAEVAEQWLPVGARIDLVLHAAGINRASSIPMKTLETFRAVRDLKVVGYQNLRHALRNHETALWCNFGSFVGFTGQLGEVDYAAGNDFLSTASAYRSKLGKDREVTICWTVWGEVGMVESHPLTSSRTKSSGRYTSMTTAEGLHHFHRELTHQGDASCVVLLGETERQSIVARVPDYFDVRKSAGSPSAGADTFQPAFYLDRVLSRDGDTVAFERVFSLSRDPYLSGHLVNGHPTLPGTFVPEIVAEAALVLFPQMRVVGFQDLRFHHFLRVYGDSPARKRIEAKTVERTPDRAVVAVRVLMDVTSPDGRVLVRDKLHFEARVVLMSEYPAAPMWQPIESSGDIALPDPYHFKQAPVYLSEVFVTTRNTRLHPMAKRASYDCSLREDDPTFRNFVTPCLMMDGLARVGVLHLYAGHYLPVAAPATIRRIDLYQAGNDCAFASRIPAGEIQLFVTPTGMILGAGDRENRCVAAGPDGRMLLQMKGVTGTIIGYVHRESGEFITPQAMEILAASKASQVVAVSDAVAPVTRVRWRPVPIPELAGEPADLAKRSVVVIGGGDDVANAVAARLRLLGAAVTRLLPDADIPSEVDGVVDLHPTGPFPDGHARPWEPLLTHSVQVLKSLFERWTATNDAQRIFYMPVTAFGGKMGYDVDPIGTPFGGIWAGLAKSLPREIPNCNIKVLDVADVPADTLAHLVCREVGVWDLFEVGYQGGQRFGLLAQTEDAGATNLRLDDTDTVLISGGGRGIGFALAEGLARKFGCRVVVTGRSALPDESAVWLSMDEQAFRAFASDKLRTAAVDGQVGNEKAKLEGLRQARELWTNLQRTRADGLHIDYEVCDFTDRDEVHRLIRKFDGCLSGVIHNAGIDTPVRLASKSTESFIATVRVKVAGFLHLLDACSATDLKFFCNVGSIAGRLGGMAGQTDYAAGNDGLARLGFWAQGRVKFPVKTVCWPTWKNLGLINNFDAAVKYMSAMEGDEGVRLWIDEICQGDSGEIGFPGRPGRAVSPSELNGFRLVTPDFPSFERLYTRAVFLGTVLEQRKFRSMRTRVALDARTMPALHAFRVGEKTAVPVSLLLEYAVALAADEILPDNWPALRLLALRNVTMDLACLALDPRQVFVFDRDAHGRWEGEHWVVQIRFVRGEREFGSVRVVFERMETPAHSSPVAESVATGEPADICGARGLAWTGIAFDAGQWARGPRGGLLAEIKPASATDLWATPYVPQLRLPVALLEAAIRVTAAVTADEGPVDNLLLDALDVIDGARQASKLVQAGRSMVYLDKEARTTHAVTGLRLTMQARTA